MASIFLSHTSIDKPFVEKLAKDLKRLGINVWFDKYEIKVGDSLVRKIEEGIKANEYLGIILTPEALRSEWVRNELDAAWAKQMQTRKIGILPILLRDCEIPLFLASKKYADFRTDYDAGLSELAAIFGIKNTETVTENNWRKFTKGKDSGWKKYREAEFEELVTALAARARDYNWSVWTGAGNNRYSLSLSASKRIDSRYEHKDISIRLCGKTNAYLASHKGSYNPNHLKSSDFTIYVGNTVNECEEYVWRQMDEFFKAYGRPEGQARIDTYKFQKAEDRSKLMLDAIRKMHWDRNMLNAGPNNSVMEYKKSSEV